MKLYRYFLSILLAMLSLGGARAGDCFTIVDTSGAPPSGKIIQILSQCWVSGDECLSVCRTRSRSPDLMCKDDQDKGYAECEEKNVPYYAEDRTGNCSNNPIYDPKFNEENPDAAQPQCDCSFGVVTNVITDGPDINDATGTNTCGGCEAGGGTT